MAETLVTGRGKENASRLLAAADKLGVDIRLVRAVPNGYLVPEEVAKEAADQDAAEKAPPKKRTTRKAKDDTEAADTKEKE